MLVSGVTSMALEMAAARLLAPFFGTSLYIWGILIGLILVYLTAGYSLGGRIADSAPRPNVFFGLNALAALAVALDGLLATPVLGGSLSATENLPYGLYAGALAGCLALFAVPVIMLGCVNPFAIRLRVAGVQQAGQASGTVFALTTIGSLIGTFGAVFWLIPSVGTRVTLYAAAGLLLVCAAAGWMLQPKHSELRTA
ncbi:MAG TPA: fused MFS/spermidine synthase [Chloroflexota bacterium]|nr:fused MFS/spermidine synthase [Chloroflexota bacterium]